ncbi:MAG: VanZ family protein [Deltaproteobacteria bacterium]|nr:VanZ family protein [Deltaproteobacteria bacterium]
MALIFYLSSQSLEELQLPEIWNIDKVVHFFEYGVLGVLWFRAIETREKIKSAAVIAFTITFLYGISDEIHQYFVPNRNASVYDVIADGLGALAGIWFYRKL